LESHPPGSNALLGEARFALARVTPMGERARTLARQALTDYRNAGKRYAHEAETILAWLKRLTAVPRSTSVGVEQIHHRP
jgi:hypothetical protein